MGWVAASLINVLISCAMAEWNRRYKLEPNLLNFYRCGLISLLLLLTYPFVVWPDNPFFYLVAGFVGITSGAASSTLFSLAKKFNGRVGSLLFPFITLFLFVIWLAYDVPSRLLFLENPLKAGVSFLCLLIACLSMLSIGAKSLLNGKGYLHILLVVSFICALSNWLGRVFLPPDSSPDFNAQMLPFIILLFIMQTLYSLMFIEVKNVKHVFSRQNIKTFTRRPVLFLSLLGMGGAYFGWLAIIASPNPAYANVIFMATPVVLWGYHKLVGIRDDFSPKAGAIFTFSVILLILLNS